MEGHGIITGGPPELLHTNSDSVAPSLKIEKITRYSWYDDGAKVKIVIEFDFDVSSDMLKIEFDYTSMKLNVLAREDLCK